MFTWMFRTDIDIACEHINANRSIPFGIDFKCSMRSRCMENVNSTRSQRGWEHSSRHVGYCYWLPLSVMQKKTRYDSHCILKMNWIGKMDKWPYKQMQKRQRSRWLSHRNTSATDGDDLGDIRRVLGARCRRFTIIAYYSDIIWHSRRTRSLSELQIAFCAARSKKSEKK